jgi:hypothetical protein
MSFWQYVDVADIITFILAVAATVGVIIAKRNINVLREQHRRNTFLSLMDELSEKGTRENRKIIHENIKPIGADRPYHREVVNVWMVHAREGDRRAFRVADAIEETIACLDKVGFFLLHGDPKLKDEAPEWIWTITNQMWEKLGDYVKHRQTSHYGYGKYFEQMANEADKHKEILVPNITQQN